MSCVLSPALRSVLFFVLFRFRLSCFRQSRGPSFNRSSVCMRSGSHFGFVYVIVSLEVLLFPSILNHCRFFFCMESTLYVFLPHDVFLTLDHGLDFDISFICENSVKSISSIPPTNRTYETRCGIKREETALIDTYHAHLNLSRC